MIGNLIILTRDKNRSYQAMKYPEKVGKYIGDNVLAQALNSTAYQNNPQFLAVASRYGFAAIPQFTKESIAARANIYLQMAVDIWDPNMIKEIAGGWEDEAEKDFFKVYGNQRRNENRRVDIKRRRADIKSPFLFDNDGNNVHAA